MTRALAILATAVIVLVGVYLLAQLFVARDDAGVAAQRGPGTLETDRGADHAAPAAPRGGEAPTSGPHRPDLVTRDARALSPDQILHALELGNVVVLYDGSAPPAALEALQEQLSGPFDAELAAAGQAIVLAEGGDGRVEALAWRRRQVANGPDDPALRDFAEAWLGKGAPGAR